MSTRSPARKPAISVLMPAHNAGKTIKVAIISALIALPRDGELICFIDGCQDETLKIVESIADSRIRIEISEKNVGIVAARRRLISLARSEYIANLDADDIALPWRFLVQLRHLRSGDCDFIFMNAILFGRKLRPFAVKPQWPVSLNSRQSDLALTFSNPFVNSSFAGRRELVIRLGGFTGTAEDYSLWLKAARAGVRMRRLSSYGVFYRVHGSQTTRTEIWQSQHRVDEQLASLRAGHLKRLSAGEKTPVATDPSLESVFAEYAHSSAMLFLQNIGLKQGVSDAWSRRVKSPN